MKKPAVSGLVSGSGRASTLSITEILAMNTRTAQKIENYKDRLWKIHQDRAAYSFTIPLLDEPYQLALKILEYDFDQDPHETARATGTNWQTVKQIRRALT